MGAINILEILKNVPFGTKLYSPLLGECTFNDLNLCDRYIVISAANNSLYHFTEFGRYAFLSHFPDAECVLFPSKENHDWMQFRNTTLTESLRTYSDEELKNELKRRNSEKKAIRQKEFDNAHRCRNCKYFEKEPNSFLSNSHICMARTWGKTTKRHYVVNGSHGLNCSQFIHK